MMKAKAIFLLIIGILLMAAMSGAVPDKEAKETELSGAVPDKGAKETELSGAVQDKGAKETELSGAVPDKGAKETELSGAVPDKGAKDMELFGGTKGKVPFPHHKHQETLGDCKVCHDVFPQTPGVIEDMKQKGNLKKKHVMNKLCITCHKDKKKAGEKSGPTSCSKCHQK